MAPRCGPPDRNGMSRAGSPGAQLFICLIYYTILNRFSVAPLPDSSNGLFKAPPGAAGRERPCGRPESSVVCFLEKVSYWW